MGLTRGFLRWRILSTLLGTIARSSNCLPALATMSLRGACRLLNEGISVLVTSACTLMSLHLGQCSLLTHFAINVVADVLGHILKELFIDDCQNINAMFVLSALKRLECLEVLSVAGIQTVCDDFISEIVTTLGSNMKEAVLANCFKITDDSLEAMRRTCSSLSAIDLSNLDLLTDSALHYLANGCRSIQTLKTLSKQLQ
ncbi:F-box protein At3g58530-like [Vitis riparia]|uniref:F-box protein At3g58530-like n=1 Tax=Vitis riparia TaxID=96939 RepID=UPI00155B0DCC|nr:F-box protein At3g58530-like [Vitis riparia]